MSRQREFDDNHPKSFQDLLKISLRLTDQETREWDSNFEPMDEERRKWLAGAFESIAESSDIFRLKKAVALLQKVPIRDIEGDDAIQERENALEEIQYLVERIDNAKDLHIIGGLKSVIQFLCSQHSGLRYRAAEAIAVAAQNNPYCQTAATQLGVIPLLLLLITSDHADIVRVKALYALSGLIQNSADAEKEFMRQRGYEALHVSLKAGIKKLRIKGSFLIRSLINQDDETQGNRILELLLNDGLAITLLNLLTQERDDSHEPIAGLLADLLSRFDLAAMGCTKLDKDIVKGLRTRKNILEAEDPECYREEITSLGVIIEKLTN